MTSLKVLVTLEKLSKLVSEEITKAEDAPRTCAATTNALRRHGAAVALALGEAFCFPFSLAGCTDVDPSSLLSLLLLLLFFLDFLFAFPFDSLAGAAVPECE